eukprot:TRINITY_DN6162_c0_g2_i1.p1 TRINITY_DN6162_c0_g2~~TRINITY_DN6162_c0_g2_i1.p1  ORF type:complete len:264 (+),score=82.16 TRINITY_DN6162_c0_g2_i1:296-1087(+)
MATATDHYRKPNTTMWDYLVQHFNGGLALDMKHSVFVGDAAGRLKGWSPTAPHDFSCTDRAFAHNVAVRFRTPEEFFLGHAPTSSWKWQALDPAAALARLAGKGGYSGLARSTQELVVMVGYPASGKSTFAKKHFVAAGYQHVNQDTLKTKEKCVKAAEQALAAGRCVVVDNTNPTAEVRKLYINAARARGVPARCFVLNTDRELAEHLNLFRERLTNGETPRIPDIGYNVFKSRYEAPSTKEGFTEVKETSMKPAAAEYETT